MSENVLITGSNSGFGRLIAETLLENNYTVIASMRDPEGRNKISAGELKALGAHVVNIDVTDDQSISKGVKDAVTQTGSIDVLVNNAGIGVIGWQEAFTIEDFEKLFDINVFGVQRMTRAVLPFMKENKKGTLIQISSLLGQFVLPFFGPYNASKHAVEALAENYRVELSGYGIESLVIEPGGFGTDFGTRLLSASDRARAESYGDAAGAPEQQMAGFEENFDNENAPDPQMVADAVLNLLKTPRGERPFRTVVDGMGMGPHIAKINETTEAATQGIYSAFGMESLLKLT